MTRTEDKLIILIDCVQFCIVTTHTLTSLSRPSLHSRGTYARLVCGIDRAARSLVSELSCREIETEKQREREREKIGVIATHGSWHVRPSAPNGAVALAPIVEVH